MRPVNCCLFLELNSESSTLVWQAGYFVWLEFPPEVDVRQLLAIATTVCQVHFPPLVSMYHERISGRADIACGSAGELPMRN